MIKMKKDHARNIIVKFAQNSYPFIKQKCPINVKIIAEQGINTLIPVQVDEKNKTVQLLSEAGLSYLFTNLSQYAWKIADQIGQFSDYDALNMSASTIRDCIEVWRHQSDSLLKAKIKPFAFKSDDCYSFARCDFDPIDAWQETPTFTQLIENFTNNDAIMAFIGSLFFEESYDQQYVWIYGGGGNGKGALIRAIKSVFGDAFHSSSYTPLETDKHWTYELIGKRLVVFPDCTNHKFVTGGLFKALTGGDSIRIERKNKDAYSVRLNCKFMFHSNTVPKINLEPSDIRRIIFSQAKNEEAFAPDPEFEKKLALETPQFISNCILRYKAACPNHGIIPNDKLGAEILAIQNEEAIHAFIERYFEPDPCGLTPASKIHETLAKYGRHIYQPQFFKILKRDYNSYSEQKRYEGRVIRVYSNIKTTNYNI